MRPIISVFVPTKNRYSYLKNLINLIESYHDARIELVIQDNSDSNEEILEFLKERTLLSTKYFYDKSSLTMSQNSDLAVSHCTGEFVTMIGDDDAVCRNIADCAEWMKKNGVDALRGIEVQFIYEDDSTLLYYDDVKPIYKILDPVCELKKQLKKGLPDFGNFSKIYHGIVSIEIINRLKEIGGTCFPGCTPDMSGAVSSCFFAKKYVMVGIPVILPGLSSMNSGGYSRICEVGEVSWISNEIKENWEPDVPKLWVREFIWPESGSKGLRYTGNEHMIKYLNYDMMKIRAFVRYRSRKDIILSNIKNKFSFSINAIRFFFTVGGRLFLTRYLLKPFNHKLNGVYNQKRDIPNIIEAEAFFANMGYYIPFDKLKLR